MELSMNPKEIMCVLLISRQVISANGQWKWGIWERRQVVARLVTVPGNFWAGASRGWLPRSGWPSELTPLPSILKYFICLPNSAHLIPCTFIANFETLGVQRTRFAVLSGRQRFTGVSSTISDQRTSSSLTPHILFYCMRLQYLKGSIYNPISCSAWCELINYRSCRALIPWYWAKFVWKSKERQVKCPCCSWIVSIRPLFFFFCMRPYLLLYFFCPNSLSFSNFCQLCAEWRTLLGCTQPSFAHEATPNCSDVQILVFVSSFYVSCKSRNVCRRTFW